MVRRTLFLTLAAVAATVATTGPAVAQRGDRGGFGSQLDNGRDDRREVSLSSVLRDLRSQFGGRHLDARKAGDRYVIAWITEDGRRLTIEVDSATGRTISVRGG
jgi:hypothetical protein